MKMIKQLRKNKKLSKLEFIKEFNIHYNDNLNLISYTMIEKGWKKPKKQTISGLKDYYGVSKDIIVNNKNVK